MLWFFLAIFGYFLMALVSVLDKTILKKSTSRPIVYAFYSMIIMVCAIVVLPFTALPQGWDWIPAILGGVSFGFALWCLYIAIDRGKISQIGPFIGGAIVVFIYILSAFFLGESLTVYQQVGILILISASLALSFHKGECTTHCGRTSFGWAVLAAFLFAISHVATKYLYINYPFLTGLGWTRMFMGLTGFTLLLSPIVRCSFKEKCTFRKVMPDLEAQTLADKKRQRMTMIANKVFAMSAGLIIQYAIAIGSVTLVTALAGVQYVFIFILALVMTKFAPRFFSEKLTKSEIILEIFVLALVISGSVLFVL